jgi:hypothetical protein
MNKLKSKSLHNQQEMHVRNYFLLNGFNNFCALYSLAKMLKLPRNKNNINCEYYDPTISQVYKWTK